MNFLQRTPFFRLLMPLVGGIVTSEYLELIPITLISLLLAAILFILWPHLQRLKGAYNLRWSFGAGIMLLLFVLGYSLASHKENSTKFSFFGQTSTYLVHLTDAPAEKAAALVIRAKILNTTNHLNKSQVSKTVLLYLQKDSAAMALTQGDLLLISTEFIRPSSVVNPRGFDYATYLRRKGIGATAFVNSGRWDWIGHHETFSLKMIAGRSRDALLKVYHRLGFNDEEFAIVAALTLGYKETIEPELRERFSHSGAMHILAVSGLHVGVIYLILQMVLSFILRGRRFLLLNTLLIVGFLWVYAFITGLPPSVIRAATMFSLVAVGKALDRRAQVYNTIAVSAFMILLTDPDYIFDIGFQLSYSAVLGIIYFQPKIAKLLNVKNKIFRWGWELTAVSIAAQLTTLPLVLFYFQQFPNYFLLTNYVAIPLATLIIYAAVLFLSLSWMPLFSSMLGVLLKSLLTLLHFAISWISSFPSAISDWSVEAHQLFPMFIFLLAIVLYLETKTYRTLLLILGSLLVFMLTDLHQNYQQLNAQQLIIYADHRHTHIDLIAGKSTQLFTTDSIAAGRVTKSFYRSSRLTNDSIVQLTGSTFFSFGSVTGAVLMDDEWLKQQVLRPFSVDVLTIGHGVRPRADALLRNFKPNVIIIPSSLRGWYADELIRHADDHGVECYLIAQSGAYVLNLNSR